MRSWSLGGWLQSRFASRGTRRARRPRKRPHGLSSICPEVQVLEVRAMLSGMTAPTDTQMQQMMQMTQSSSTTTTTTSDTQTQQMQQMMQMTQTSSTTTTSTSDTQTQQQLQQMQQMTQTSNTTTTDTTTTNQLTLQQMEQMMQQTQASTTTTSTNTTSNQLTLQQMMQMTQSTSGTQPAPGSWTPLTNLAPDSIGTMMLLPDGRVMAVGESGPSGVSNLWYALTPDSKGNYINGTWSSLAPMSLQRLYVGSNVLPNGKVFVVGGEYSGSQGQANWVNSGQIYDIGTNSWSNIPNFPQANFGDDPTIVLPNGQILAGYLQDGRTYLYNPTSNSWSQTGTKLGNDASDEETWVMLPNGNVLSYDVFANRDGGAASAQMYNVSGPNAGKWTDAGVVPVALTNGSAQLGFELGPAALLPDGNHVFQVGANGHTAIYTISTNSWVQGPDVPGLYHADDAPGAMLTNGHFLFAADAPPGIFLAPTKLFDFDPVANTITDVTPGSSLGATLAGLPAFTERMLELPNGDILLTTANNQLWEYTPTGSPNAAWAPTISNVSVAGNVFTITGTQLNGLSQGASYGDDAEMDSNYPIVKLTDAFGNVRYATSLNWTPGVATGNATVTSQFKLPAGLAGSGTYTLNVIANGIASADFTLNLLGAPQNVQATALTPTTAQVTWNTVQGDDGGYQVFMVTGLGDVAVTSVLPPGTTGAVATGLVPNSVNTLFVRVYSSTFLPFQADSAHVQVTTPQGLVAPQNVQVFALSPTTAFVSWNAVLGADLGYQVYLVTGFGPQLLGSTSSTSLIVSGLTAGVTNTLFVRALSDNFTPFVADSAGVNILMPAALNAPQPFFTNITSTTAVLNWASVPTADGYRVFEQINGQQVLVASVDSSITSVQIVGLTPGATTYFMVEAFRANVVSDSGWVSVVTPLATLQPIINNPYTMMSPYAPYYSMYM